MKALLVFALMSCLAGMARAEAEKRDYNCTLVGRRSGDVFIGASYRIHAITDADWKTTYSLGSVVSLPGAEEKYVEDGKEVEPDKSYLLKFEKAGLFARDIRSSIVVWDDRRVGVCEKFAVSQH
jgi:hypothetical protein